MAVDKERQLMRQNEYVKNTYDRFTVTFPKGMKEVYKARAKQDGIRLNTLINKLLEEYTKKSPD